MAKSENKPATSDAEKGKTTPAKNAREVVNTGTAPRVPAPERLDPAASVHSDEGNADPEAIRTDAVEAAKASPTGVPEDQATTSGEPPVTDPERAPYNTTVQVGYRPRNTKMATDPNEALPEEDKKWGIASRARWGETTPAELAKEQAEINKNQRKLDDKK